MRGAARVLTRRLSTPALEFPEIVITRRCAERISTLNRDRSGAAERYLRLAVEGGGCSGFQYVFSMCDGEIGAEDDVFTREDTRVVIDRMSLDFVRGSTVDFTEELIRRSFVVLNNPNTENACGCGTSFAVKETEEEDDDDSEDSEDGVR